MSRKGRKDESVEPVGDGLPWWRRPGRGALLSVLCMTGVVLAVFGALERLKGRVQALPEYNPTAKIELLDTPRWLDQEEWRPQILASVRLPEKPNWLDGSVPREVGEQLSRSGWVSSVKRVTQDVDGTIRVACDYRRPIAMVRTKHDEGIVYVAIDRDGVRLPQLYRDVEQAGWMQIVGVQSEPPAPGQPFESKDAVAAVRLATLIFRQDFAPRISAIDVSNFYRQNRRQSQILLRTRDNKEITWGSPIGDEYEEPTAEDKIRNIAHFLKNGASHTHVDVSVFRDRWLIRTEPDIRTADGSTSRN